MKKTIITAIAVIGILTSQAQVMKKGQSAANLGVGLPGSNIYVNGTTTNIAFPAFIGSFDYGVTDMIGIGYITGGAQLVVAGSKGSDSFSNGWKYEYNSTHYTIGPRAAYHFDMEDVTGSRNWAKIDIYGGVFVGVTVTSEKYKRWDNSVVTDQSTNIFTKASHNVFIGGRYNFTPAIGFYSETGYNVSTIHAGFTFRF